MVAQKQFGSNYTFYHNNNHKNNDNKEGEVLLNELDLGLTNNFNRSLGLFSCCEESSMTTAKATLEDFANGVLDTMDFPDRRIASGATVTYKAEVLDEALNTLYKNIEELLPTKKKFMPLADQQDIDSRFGYNEAVDEIRTKLADYFGVENES